MDLHDLVMEKSWNFIVLKVQAPCFCNQIIAKMTKILWPMSTTIKLFSLQFILLVNLNLMVRCIKKHLLCTLYNFLQYHNPLKFVISDNFYTDNLPLIDAPFLKNVSALEAFIRE